MKCQNFVRHVRHAHQSIMVECWHCGVSSPPGIRRRSLSGENLQRYLSLYPIDSSHDSVNVCPKCYRVIEGVTRQLGVLRARHREDGAANIEMECPPPSKKRKREDDMIVVRNNGRVLHCVVKMYLYPPLTLCSVKSLIYLLRVRLRSLLRRLRPCSGAPTESLLITNHYL